MTQAHKAAIQKGIKKAVWKRRHPRKPCRFCKDDQLPHWLKRHEKNCDKNPKNMGFTVSVEEVTKGTQNVSLDLYLLSVERHMASLGRTSEKLAFLSKLHGFLEGLIEDPE